jgi:anti-anti-sigma regulatory factor
MPHYRYLELLETGTTTTARLLSHGYIYDQELAEVEAEWNSVADLAAGKTLVLDCSLVHRLSTDILSKLIVLQRRMQRAEGQLLISGLRPAIREVLRYTRLDRVLAIKEADKERAVPLA